MSHDRPSNDESCRLLLPRPSLAGCILFGMVRDTRHLDLKPDERMNFFPASPYCGITLFFEGCGTMLDYWSPADIPHVSPKPMPAIVFHGPTTRPTAGHNQGSVYVLLIAFYPEAMHALGGPQPTKFIDKMVGTDAALAPRLTRLFAEAREAGQAEATFDMLQIALDPLWQGSRPDAAVLPRMVSDWTRHLAKRAATIGIGRSARQIERRFKDWTGQSKRDLVALARTEATLKRALRQREQGRADWAQIAADTGFSDQSHMVRHTRRYTGFTPVDLRKRIKSDQAFWFYRMLGEL